MKKRGFFYLKNLLISSVLFSLFISIPPVFASQLNQTLTYDGNGNLITGDGKYREYNEFNQLIRVYDGSYPNGTILESYLYHPTENRILIKYGDYGSTTPDQAVVYVNDNLEKTYDVLSSTPRVNYTYYPSDENGLVGEIVKNSTNATLRTLYYHNDYSGSVSLITNGSGGVVEQTFYDPYGAILVGGDVSRYSYEGKEFSSVTEDFDFHFRKYDPSLMIFTQPDSVISNVYDPQSLNRYSFEKNNPYKYTDDDGKSPLEIILIGAGIGAVAGVVFYALEVHNGDLTFSWKGLGSYALGGAITGAVGAAVIAFSAGLGVSMAAGVASSVASQVITNYGTDKPLGQNVGSAAVLGIVSTGFSELLPKTPGLNNIKYFESYFTKQSGQQFISNRVLAETVSSAFSTGNTLPQQLIKGSFGSSKINIDKSSKKFGFSSAYAHSSVKSNSKSNSYQSRFFNFFRRIFGKK
jgi:RHS repeat-associated protein